MQKTSERLKNYKYDVVEAWVESIRNQISIAARTDRARLIDNFPQFIEDLIVALKAEGCAQNIAPTDTWKEHALQRVHQTELSLVDMIREYQLLRSIILETLWDQDPLPESVILFINKTVDDAIVKAVTVFERERIEARTKDQQLASIFLKSVPDPFFILDDNWKYIYINESAAQQSHHRNKTDLLGRNFWDIHPEVIGSYIQRKLERAMKQRKQVQFEFYHEPSDEWFSVDCYPNEIGIAVFFRDISDRVCAERKLMEQKALLEAVIEKMPAGVRIHDARTGKILISNYEISKLMADGESITSWEDFKKLKVKHEDGSYYKLHEYPSVRALHGEYVRDEQASYRDASGEDHYFLTSACPIKDQHGQITHVVSVITEIGDLKKAQMQLYQSNRDLSVYSATVAHDLKSPINTIASMTELLSLKNAEKFDSESEEMMRFIVTASKRMQKLIDNLLSYARINEETEPFTTVDLNDVLSDVKKNLKDPIEVYQAKILYGKLPKIYGDEVQMTSLFQNLISNSIKFRSKDPPVIEITAEDRENCELLKVRDNGIGFDPRHASHLFEPFTRLHGSTSYEGTGLGLSICKRIVERHRGRIWVESAPGSGTTFFIQLPKAIIS